MKIENDLATSETLRTYRANKPSGGSTGPSFSDILSQAVNGGTGANSTQESRATNPATASDYSTPITQTPVWQKTSGLVDALDSYGAALGNHNLTLKQMEPLTNNLDQQAEDLAGSLSQDSDDSLNSLAWQAVTQARAEVIKFRRGDYV
jgi:hypothetical protein